MTRLERLKQLRDAAMLTAESLPDEAASKIPTMFEPWEVNVEYKEGDRRSYNDLLYKCRSTHTSQADWTPDKTPALWAVVEDGSQSGTVDDPIPAARGMDYIYGKYYLDPEDSKTYKCERPGEAEGGVINLQYLPHELIGQYFTLIS